MIWLRTNYFNITESNINNLNDNIAWVYRLWFINPNDNEYHVFYIGQANDIKRRMKEHISVNEPNTCIKNYFKKYVCGFRYCSATTQQERDNEESLLYEKFSPDCNIQTP